MLSFVRHFNLQNNSKKLAIDLLSKQDERSSSNKDKVSQENQGKLNTEDLIKSLSSFDLIKDVLSISSLTGEENNRSIIPEDSSNVANVLNTKDFTSKLLGDLILNDSEALSEKILQQRMINLKQLKNTKEKNHSLLVEEEGSKLSSSFKEESASEEVSELEKILQNDKTQKSNPKLQDGKIDHLKEAITKELKYNIELSRNDTPSESVNIKKEVENTNKQERPNFKTEKEACEAYKDYNPTNCILGVEHQ